MGGVHITTRFFDHCHVTQPTLSNGIAHLEDDLGAKLFYRTTRSVQLTSFGKHLLSSIERALADVDEIRALATSWRHPEHKLVRIGLSPVIDMRLLLNVLAPFRDGHPDVKFFFKECFIDDLDQRLSSDLIDLMLLPCREERLGQQRIEFYAEPLLYLPRDGSSLASSDKAIRISEAPKTISSSPWMAAVLGRTHKTCSRKAATQLRNTRDKR